MNSWPAAGRVTGASWVFMRSASSTDRQLLQRWLKAPTTPQRVVRRSRIVLLAIDGMREQDIAAKVGVSRPTVRLWLSRFDKLGARATAARGRGSAQCGGPAGEPSPGRGVSRDESIGTVASVEEGASVTPIGVESKWRN